MSPLWFWLPLGYIIAIILVDGMSSVNFLWYIFLFAGIITITPGLVLYVNYVIIDFQKQITIDFNSNIITYKKTNIQEQFKIDDLKTIMSVGDGKNRNLLMGLGFYRYYIFKFKDGRSFLTTNLIINRIPEEFEGRIRDRFTFFALPD